MRVPVSSQRRGKSEVSAAQLDSAMRHETVKAFFKDNLVFDGALYAYPYPCAIRQTRLTLPQVYPWDGRLLSSCLSMRNELR